jgi:uncharacterized protein (DUF433 family)
MGGVPCFKGTRIPVHDIAAMIANGDTRPAILEAYPSLTREHLELGLFYTEAYPRRGRPRRRQPWHNTLPTSSERRRLSDLLRDR